MAAGLATNYVISSLAIGYVTSKNCQLGGSVSDWLVFETRDSCGVARLDASAIHPRIQAPNLHNRAIDETEACPMETHSSKAVPFKDASLDAEGVRRRMQAMRRSGSSEGVQIIQDGPN